MKPPPYSISWNLGSRCSFRRTAMAHVEVRATLGHWFWKRDVVRELRYSVEAHRWVWANGLVLDFAPAWVWTSLLAALETPVAS